MESDNLERQPPEKGEGGQWMLKDKPGNVPCEKKKRDICISQTGFISTEDIFSFPQNVKYFAERKLTFLS